MTKQVQKTKEKGKETEKKTWEELVEEGCQAIESRDDAQWKLGDLANDVTTHYGQEDLQKYADEIAVNYNSLRVYEQVSEKFEFDTRVLILLPWSYFRVVVGLDLPTAMVLLKEAKENGWTYRELEAAVEALRSETPPLPKGPFDVIYADPPWEYEFSMSPRGDPKRHYDTMSVDEICALEIPASKNAILFLWATNPKLEEALKVIEAWGFQYRTNLVWVKDKFGTGYYFRGQHELLLVAKRGETSVPLEELRHSSVLEAPRKQHSEKPNAVYEMIERMYPNRKYVELFARQKRPKWEAWGLEA